MGFPTEEQWISQDEEVQKERQASKFLEEVEDLGALWQALEQLRREAIRLIDPATQPTK
jgi:hypothetical protein